MIIKQEEKSPVQNAFDKLHLSVAFDAITSMSGNLVLDTELYKTYVEETINLLKKLNTEICAIERETIKTQNKNNFKEKLFGNDPYGD